MVIGKSGGNQFHGGVYEYFRNTDFDARGFFAAVLPPDHQNEFGVTVSGPIRKNKLFIFGNYDGYRLVSATTPVGYQSIPTVKERTGDFSEFPQLIYDPTSATGTAARTPVPSTAMNGISRRVGRGSQMSKAGRGKDRGGSWYDHMASVTRPRPSTALRATPQ